MFRKLIFIFLGLLLSLQVNAQDAADYRDQVQTMYVAYYGRPGDEGGIDFWANQLAEVNGDLAAIIDSFGNSDEFQSRFGDQDSEILVNNIFLQLLGRNADAAGLAFYVGELAAGNISLASIALNVFDGAQNEDVNTIANKLVVANAFTEAYVTRNVSYGEAQINDAKLLLDSVDSTSASVTAALDGLNDLLDTFSSGGAVRVLLETTHGNIVLEMYAAEAPITVANFLAYVDAGFYDDLWFHRIAARFVVQGGGFYLDPDNGSQLLPRATNAAIVNESSNGLSNLRTTVAMARTGDPDSATSQFFINVVDNVFLDYQDGEQGYAVFAIVVSGMEVVEEMSVVPTFSNEIPQEEVKMISVTRVAN